MSARRFTLVVGTRPNFVKAAPLVRAAALRDDFEIELVHTGQHYDRRLSDLFFRDLGLPKPDLYLEVGSGTHAEQTALVMQRLEPILMATPPERLVVFGDVNSTVAAALTAVKLGVSVAHVEAGLRSFDDSMPEEINRRLTDCMSHLLFTTEQSGNENLRREGVPAERVHFVGNTMVDSLVYALPAIAERRDELLASHGVERRGYAVLTLHRPANVDSPAKLAGLLDAVLRLAGELPVLFPAHPRTRARLDRQPELRRRLEDSPRVRLLPPLGYLDFLGLIESARLALTDSGGLQEETTALGVGCLTLRDNTERPVTLTAGTNKLVGTDPAAIESAARELLRSPPASAAQRPPLWDGRAAERIVEVLATTTPTDTSSAT